MFLTPKMIHGFQSCSLVLFLSLYSSSLVLILLVVFCAFLSPVPQELLMFLSLEVIPSLKYHSFVRFLSLVIFRMFLSPEVFMVFSQVPGSCSSVLLVPFLSQFGLGFDSVLRPLFPCLMGTLLAIKCTFSLFN